MFVISLTTAKENCQKADVGGKTQGICPKLTVNSGHTKNTSYLWAIGRIIVSATKISA